MTGSRSQAWRGILVGLLGGLLIAAPASSEEPAPAGPLVDLAARVAEHGAEVAIPGTGGADGPLGGITAARLRLADNDLARPRDRVFFGYDYFDNVRLAAPVTPRDAPGFERAFLDSVVLRIPFPTDPLLLEGSRDEFGPYFVVPPGPVYEGGGPGDSNFGKNRGINAFRGPEGWVVHSTVFDGTFTPVATGAFAYLMPEAVVMIIPFDEVAGWEQVTVRSPDDAVDVDLAVLPELLVEGVDGDTLLIAGDAEPPQPPEETTTTATQTATTAPATATTVEAAADTEAGGGVPWPLIVVLAALGLAGGAWWWLRAAR